MNSPLRPVALSAAVVLAAAAAPVASGAPPGILYAADASGVRISRAADGMRVSLPTATPVTWFTDRPARRSGTTTMRGLARIWSASGFASDPPNAALVLDREKAKRSHVVTMSRPRLSGDGRRVSYRVVAVPDGVEAGHVTAHDLVAGSYPRAQIFIDDAAVPPCPSLIYVVPAGGTSCLLSPWDMVEALAVPGRPPLVVSACLAHGTPGTLKIWGVHPAPTSTIGVNAPCPESTFITPVAPGILLQVTNIPIPALPEGIIQVTVKGGQDAAP